MRNIEHSSGDGGTQEPEPDFRWNTGEKSSIVTPHLWNDYNRIAEYVYHVLRPEHQEYAEEGLHGLAHESPRPPLLSDRWKMYPYSDVPKEPLSDLDQKKVAYLDQLSTDVESLVQKLREATQGVPLRDPEGSVRLYGKDPRLPEPYASRSFNFNLDSPEYQKVKDQVLALVQEIAALIEKARKFFYH